MQKSVLSPPLKSVNHWVLLVFKCRWSALLISMTSVLLILNKIFPVSSSVITQVAEHVIVQANVLWVHGVRSTTFVNGSPRNWLLFHLTPIGENYATSFISIFFFSSVKVKLLFLNTHLRSKVSPNDFAYTFYNSSIIQIY